MTDRGDSDEELRCAVPAVPESVAALRREARGYAAARGAGPDVLHAVALAVTEAATNVVVHAYRDAPAPGPVELCMRAADDGLDVVVRDEGIGMVPRPDSPGMGVGLPLITSLADEVAVHRDGGTCVRMRFALSPDRGAASTA